MEKPESEFTLKRSINIKLTPAHGGYIITTCDELDLDVFSDTLPEALGRVVEHLDTVWKKYVDTEETLTPMGVKISEKLRDYIEKT